jgi:cysteine desulfurase
VPAHRDAYFDHAATSPLRPEALSAMLPYLSERFGNPSGAHGVARRARDAVEDGRDVMARHLGCEPAEVVFSSGGTESCNLAVLGVFGDRGGGIVCTAFEHPSVLGACDACGGSRAPVRPDGIVDLDGLAELLGPHVRLVSVMLVNNEVGTVQPLAEVARLVRLLAPEALVHTDAVGAGAWIDLAEQTASADLVSVGAHKFGGPKGVGALVVRGGARLVPLLHGGAQERGRRPGTHNVAGIVGMAAALEAAARRRSEESAAVAALRRRLVDGLSQRLVGVHVTAPSARKLPGSCHLRFEGVHQEELLVLLDDLGVCASGGSACASGALEPSHVLLAMGLTPAQARQAVRFSLGWNSTADDVELALAVVPKAVERLRSG